jgi:glutamate---cysteine ligase / carboxylate-amine ligase
LALAANSPFWLGVDTGYASFRTVIWRRWPMAGTPQFFASRAEYDTLVDTLVKTGSLSDATKIYWDVRPSARFETLEFRITDVCLTIDEALLIAGLSRALVRTCYDQAIKNESALDVRPELLRAAKWRAARYGFEGELIDVADKRAIPAHELIEKLLATLRPALEAYGDWDEINTLTHDTLARGNGATPQRAAYARRGHLEDVVDLLIAETAQGT